MSDPNPHMQLTGIRTAAYAELFGEKPATMFPAHQLVTGPDDPFLIDVLVYPLEVEGLEGPVVAAVTNGMSDIRMAEGDAPEQPRRRELIQYFRQCTPGHAQRLRDMAWLPLYDEFLLDAFHTIAWEWPAVEGTPWKNAVFLEPLWRPHREFTVVVEGDEVSLLWHVPLSDAELAFKREHGIDDLLDRMDEVGLHWIFDEGNRPPLVG